MITLEKARTFRKNLANPKIYSKLKMISLYHQTGEGLEGDGYQDFSYLYRELMKSFVGDNQAQTKAYKLIHQAAEGDKDSVKELKDSLKEILNGRISRGKLMHVDVFDA
jgi:hypothetical protein